MAFSKWHEEADVVVVGYGAAGAVAAIAAHDAGAKVLILEKGDHPGGLSLLAGGGFKCIVEDLNGAERYFTRLSGGRISGDIIRTFIEGLAQNADFIKKLAEVDGAEITASQFKGGSYPFEGGEKLCSFVVTQVPGFTWFPWAGQPVGIEGRGQNLIKMLMDNVERRGIKVMLSTPARRLMTDHTGVVQGVIAQGREELAVKATRGLVLACGGFEQNEWLKLHFFEGKPIYSVAPSTHTGDGVIMSQKVGAALWHMWLVHGTYGFKYPEIPIAMGNNFGGPRNPQKIMPWIIVDKRGRRYMNEDPPIPNDTPFRYMQVFDPDIPGYPRIPSYMIFDEAGRKKGPIGISRQPELYVWSQDNSQEIKKGWIVCADTIGQLAAKLRESKENESLMDGKTLEETIINWNLQVKTRKDILGRLPATMIALETPPFYGAQVWPIINNTQGGPVHNTKQQVLDAFLNPIRRLYVCGELGSFFGHLYQAGGNLGECLASGRIAGRNVAAEEPWSEIVIRDMVL